MPLPGQGTTDTTVKSGYSPTLFPKKPDHPLIAFLKMSPRWRDHLASLKQDAEDFVKLAADGGPFCRDILDDLVKNRFLGTQGPTKIFLMTALVPEVTDPIIGALKRNYAKPTDEDKLQLFKFYQQENGILPLLTAAFGQETIHEFTQQLSQRMSRGHI